jgi:hypothetical protein
MRRLLSSEIYTIIASFCTAVEKVKSILEQAMKAQGGNTDAFTRFCFGSPKPDDSNSLLPFHYPASTGNIE